MLPTARHTKHPLEQPEDTAVHSQLGSIAAAYGLPIDTIPTRD